MWIRLPKAPVVLFLYYIRCFFIAMWGLVDAYEQFLVELPCNINIPVEIEKSCKFSTNLQDFTSFS